MWPLVPPSICIKALSAETRLETDGGAGPRINSQKPYNSSGDDTKFVCKSSRSKSTDDTRGGGILLKCTRCSEDGWTSGNSWVGASAS